MEKHFVEFLGPGTFMSETQVSEIATWDISKAVEMAGTVEMRHGARPYGFRFLTRSRGETDLDSKVSNHSGIYYLGGKVETLAEIEARHDPADRILIDNMRCNDYARAITNKNSYEFTAYFNDTDTLLDVKLPAITKAKGGEA